MRRYEKVFAVREKETQKLISKRRSNPFFTMKKNAENFKKDMENSCWGYNEGDLEVVSFKLEEVENE
ncbi:MAG: hypothetical protein ACLTPN_02540 [Clostridia bacterium]